MKKTMFVLCTLVAVSGCSDDLDNKPANCPALKPTEGASCTLPSASQCTFLIEKCACGPSDVEWSCGCQNGKWACTRGYDCYPCDGGVGQEGGVVTPDGSADPCLACKADEVCVQSIDGTCISMGVECKKVSSACTTPGNPTTSCNKACEAEYCAAPTQCQNVVTCGKEHPTARVYCYGP